VALALILGYLIGGIPTGIIVCRAIAGVDPRSLGSGSMGATNVSRVVGKKWAAVVLILDTLKGLLPILVLARLLAPPDYSLTLLHSDQEILVRIALAFGAVIGHVWTPYASFRGGKGIATGAGAVLALDPPAMVLAVGVWILLFALFRRVSVASLGGAVAVPLTMIFLGGRPQLFVWAAVVLCMLLIFTHRENIHRLLTGREKPIA